MASSRKTGVSRGSGETDNDPERENRTQARAPNPIAEDDPERENKTHARAQAPAPEDEDPERANSTQARAPNPLNKKVRAQVDPERANKTQARARAPEPNEESYHTGQSYAPPQQEDEGFAGELDGDGLEALDPELGSRTKALPALEAEEESSVVASNDEEEGADDANATRAGPPLKLEIVGGPDAGKKKKFKGVRMVIGRTPGVDLQLSDASVSRRHVELIYGDDGVLMKDLGSGNGTKVNGTKVAEKKLEHGDEIAIGKTRIRFVDEMAAFKKARDENEKKEADAKAASEKKAEDKKAAASKTDETEDSNESSDEGSDEADDESASEGEEEAPKKSKTGTENKKRVRPVRTARGAEEGGVGAKFKALPKPIRLGIVGLLVVIVLILIAGVALRPPPPPPIEPSKIAADQKMQEARNAMRENDFERAVALIEEAERASPGVDRTNLGKQARDGLACRTGIDGARKLIGENRFDDARKSLDSAAGCSVKLDEEKVKVRAEMEAAMVQYKRSAIEALIAATEIEKARSLLAELPVEFQAEPAQKIAEYEDQLKTQEALDAKDEASRKKAAAAAQRARREQEIFEAFQVVERKFAGAEWDRAASECSRVMDVFSGDKDIYGRARKLQALIPSFGRNYDEGMKKYRAGQKSQAAKPLREAWSQYLSIDLKANTFGQELKDRIGDCAIVAGKEALVREDLVTAWQNFKAAAAFEKDNPKVMQGLDEVAAKAEDLYATAYVIRDRDQREAVRKFQIVIKVTDPGTAVHEKAKNQLAAMAP